MGWVNDAAMALLGVSALLQYARTERLERALIASLKASERLAEALALLAGSSEVRLSALEANCHEPVAIRPRVIGVLRELAPDMVAHIWPGSEGPETDERDA